MRIYIYDFEVVAHDWLVVIRAVDSPDYTVIHNDNIRFREWIQNHPDDIIGGFNSKHYDDWIAMTIIEGGDPETVKRCNDWIILEHKNGWEFPFVQFKRKPFRSFDLRDDLPKSLSLKAIEGNMYLPIVESSVPFDIDRELTDAELEEMIYYCKKDVDATVALYERRREYIASKITVAELKGIDPAVALGKTNAKLAALYLDASPVDRVDGRRYEIPPVLDQSIIPPDVLAFFRQINDLTIPDAELYEKNLVYEIGGCDCVFAWGGVHGALPNIIAETDPEGTPDRRIIVNYDVASLYPNSMLNFGYVSRNCRSPTAYRDLVQTRIAAKKAGNKAVANALKLVINTTYGAMLDSYNDLYDEKCGRSVCISNQLAMCELVRRLEIDVPSFEILNFNTDGVMFRILESEMKIAEPILEEWQRRTGFELERDDVKRLVQKDVNNYLAEEGGKIKACGDYVKRWQGDAVTSENDIKARLINNDLTIVQIALVERLLHDVPVEKTITDCQNPFYFQQIAKFGPSYASAFHDVDGERVPVQKVNRVYATTDPRFGTVKKVKPTGEAQRIANLPDHCIIDNENRITIDQIDKQFYIDLANTRVDQYLNGKRTKKRTREDKPMAAPAKDTRNVYERLLAARQDFFAANVKKSGVNRFAEFDYFELADIVPVATEIFAKHRIMLTVTFDEMATALLVNLDDPHDAIAFQSPMRQLDYSKIKGMNALQGLGSEETYQRRYLYMMVLDIVEHDTIDATSGSPTQSTKNDAESASAARVTKPSTSTKPASKAERDEIKQELTNKDSDADEQQIEAIKRGLKKLRGLDPATYEGYIAECMSKLPTKKNPSRKISRKAAEDMQIEIGKKLEEAAQATEG